MEQFNVLRSIKQNKKPAKKFTSLAGFKERKRKIKKVLHEKKIIAD